MSEKMDKKHFWRGIKHKINPCCIMFFSFEWDTIRNHNDDYAKTMSNITNQDGIVLCPSCIIKKIIK